MDVAARVSKLGRVADDRRDRYLARRVGLREELERGRHLRQLEGARVVGVEMAEEDLAVEAREDVDLERLGATLVGARHLVEALFHLVKDVRSEGMWVRQLLGESTCELLKVEATRMVLIKLLEHVAHAARRGRRRRRRRWRQRRRRRRRRWRRRRRCRGPLLGGGFDGMGRRRRRRRLPPRRHRRLHLLGGGLGGLSLGGRRGRRRHRRLRTVSLLLCRLGHRCRLRVHRGFRGRRLHLHPPRQDALALGLRRRLAFPSIRLRRRTRRRHGRSLHLGRRIRFSGRGAQLLLHPRGRTRSPKDSLRSLRLGLRLLEHAVRLKLESRLGLLGLFDRGLV